MSTAQQKQAGSDYIHQLYDAELNSQKELLKQNYEAGLSDLEEQQIENRQQTDTNLTRTYVEAAKAAKSYGELQNAYGLTSGAMAQAKLAQGNQLNADLTNLRGIQQNADAAIERQRGILAKEYASAIAKAQGDNDMARAQALYQDAAAEEDRLLQMQEGIAALFAQKGDYSYYQKLYGLTEEQMAQLIGSGGGGGSEEKKTYSSTPPQPLTEADVIKQFVKQDAVDSGAVMLN